jgi:hypothetical protein
MGHNDVRYRKANPQPLMSQTGRKQTVHRSIVKPTRRRRARIEALAAAQS